MERQYCKFFLIFSLLMLLLGCSIGVMFGKPSKLIRGYDSDGFSCGVDSGLEEYPYIYFVNPTNEYRYRTVCVRTCPTQDTQQLDCITNEEVKDCKQNLSILAPEKAVFYYETFPYKGNVCMPTNLEYYKAVQDFALPVTFKRIVNDAYQAIYLLLSLGFVNFFVCRFLMNQLKDNTTYLVWMFSILSIMFIGVLGVYFAVQYRFATTYNEQEDKINNFKVSEDYIYRMSNQPSELFNMIIGILFIVIYLYASIWLYNNTDKVQDLADMFEYVEKFVKNNEYIEQLSFVFLITYSIIYFLLYLSVILLMSCFTFIADNDYLGPFEKTEPSTYSYIAIISIIGTFWIMTTINGAYQFIIFKQFNKWLDGNIDLVDDNQINLENNNQLITLARSTVENLNINLIGKISLGLLFSFIKFILDSIKDTLQAIFKCSFNPFKSLAVLEEVLYYAASQEDQNLDNAIKQIKETLQINKDGKHLEAFEQVRNINDFFLLIIKAFSFLLFGILFLGLYFLTQLICQIIPQVQFLQLIIYQPLIPAVICGAFAFYFTQIYFCQYTVVQCFGYVYLKLMQDDNARRKFQDFQNSFGELTKMMQRCLQDEDNNNNQGEY